MTDSTVDLYPGNVLFTPSIRLTDDKVESHKPLKRRPRDVATSGTLPLYIDPGEPLAEVCRLDSSVNIQLADMGSGTILGTVSSGISADGQQRSSCQTRQNAPRLVSPTALLKSFFARLGMVASISGASAVL